MLKVKTLAVSAFMGLVSLAPIGVMADGAALVKDKCVACHTESGNSTNETVPNIAGFSVVTLEDMMTSYKEGDRKGAKYKPENGEESDMNEVTENLSENDIKMAAEYYSKKTFKAQKNATDPALVKKGAKIHKKYCEKCHSDGGANADDDAAILAGQWMAYLKKEFHDIKEKERIVPKKMRKVFKKLKDDDIERLIHFYAAGQ